MAVYANFTIDQGSDFSSTIDVEDNNNQPVNLTNYLIRGQIRKTYTSSTSYSFSASIPNAAAGSISITLPASVTSTMKAGRYVYDVEMISEFGVITRVIEGQVEITPRVTRT